MIAVWILGIALVVTLGVGDLLSEGWFHVKLAGILAMTWFHHWLSVHRKALERGTDETSGRTYRMMNEVPTVLMVVIVLMVVLKPF